MGNMNNRSNKWTSGLTVQIPDNPHLRYFLFELDKEHICNYKRVLNFFILSELDVLIHKTGSGGYHFISPTVIQKDEWKGFHEILKDINSICPMTTLRIVPNKYPNEDQYWYRYTLHEFSENFFYNSKELCIYLNHIFGSNLSGMFNADFRTVRYRLP